MSLECERVNRQLYGKRTGETGNYYVAKITKVFTAHLIFISSIPSVPLSKTLGSVASSMHADVQRPRDQSQSDGNHSGSKVTLTSAKAGRTHCLLGNTVLFEAV
ncbi:hypothetical protein CHARACLAT_023941 [Characodon lateralis]|uniref:Uncharacterized protein n=1 Tax=Characodon lateralis TaxID=208331 RepID=A0ABU7D3N6_9TELE|nr:hypothetical protein [Characodon lateralis]